MSTPAERLITLILLLQNRPNQKAADLAQQLGVSARTLQRYILMLEEMGIPVYSERGPHGGFSLVSGYKMPPLVFGPAEAAALSLGAGLVEEVWGSLFQDAARSALAKLDHFLPQVQKQEVAWARRSLRTAALQPPQRSETAPLLETLRCAMQAQRQVRIRYQGANRTEPTERQVDPYLLVYRWGWWYLVGFCHLRSALRAFRVDRMLAAVPCAETFCLPEDFDGQAYVAAGFQDQSGLLVRMRFAAGAAQVALQNRSYWESLQDLPDGSVEVTGWFPDVEWAASSALAFGPMLKVIDPPAVAQQVQAWARAIAESYST